MNSCRNIYTYISTLRLYRWFDIGNHSLNICTAYRTVVVSGCQFLHFDILMIKKWLLSWFICISYFCKCEAPQKGCIEFVESRLSVDLKVVILSLSNSMIESSDISWFYYTLICSHIFSQHISWNIHGSILQREPTGSEDFLGEVIFISKLL